MPRYIDAEVLEKWLKEFYPARLEMISGVRNTPTAPVETVVHCGECQFFQLRPNDDFAEDAGICIKNSHYCDFSRCEADRFNTDFCSYGKRKDVGS